jgi:nucleoid DNA-binding protein
MATASKKPAAKPAAAKKPAAKVAAAKKPAAKKPVAAAKAPAAKAAAPNLKPAAMKPIPKALSKQALIAHLAEHAAVELKAVKAVVANLEATIFASLHKKGARNFVWPGLFKATVVSVPAKPSRKGINPFTKEPQVFAAKPASTKIKVRMLKKAKEAAN